LGGGSVLLTGEQDVIDLYLEWTTRSRKQNKTKKNFKSVVRSEEKKEIAERDQEAQHETADERIKIGEEVILGMDFA